MAHYFSGSTTTFLSRPQFPWGALNQWLFKWIQTHSWRQNLFSGVLCLKDFPSACTNFLQLHFSLKHIIHIAFSFSLSFRDIRPTLKVFPTGSAPLFFFFLFFSSWTYFSNKSFGCCKRLYFIFWYLRYQFIIPKISKCTLFGKRVFVTLISLGFGNYWLITLVGPNAITHALIRERMSKIWHKHKQRRRQCED